MIQIDMKMPKDCYHCPCHKHWDVNNYICGITGDTANYIGFRRDFCPLIEVSNEPILDKIRAEIRALSNANPSYWHSGDMVERDDVLEILDKYKAGVKE